MARFERGVTSGDGVDLGIVGSLGLFVVLVEWLREQGLQEEIGKRFRIRGRRGDGYSGEDVFYVLLGLFASGWRCGIKQFLRDTQRWGSKLACLCGRKRWPTQAAMSRALQAVSTEEVEAFLQWLLVDVMGRLKGRPDLESWRDRRGEDWAAFAWDGRVTPFRLRGLPVGPELPEPKRRMDRVAAPGYAGRKQRADLQWNVSKVVGAGSGLFVNVRVGAGNGSVSDQLGHAHAAVQRWCCSRQMDPARCVIVSDGVGRGYEQVAAGQASPVCFLTRFAHYSLLESEEAAAVLASATWEPVEDSGSGPKREATGFGQTASADGAVMNLVVSRYPLAQDQEWRGCGHRQGAWVHELFGTDLPTDSFHPGDAVCLYFSRTGIESVFACENREFAAGRLYSANANGQELCLGIAAFVWNLQMALGVEIVEQMGELPAAPPVGEKRCPSGLLAAETEPAPRQQRDEEQHLAKARAGDGSPPPVAPVLCCSEDIPWEEKLRPFENWTWDSELGTIRCPAGFPMRLKRIMDRPNGEKTYRFRAPRHRCSKCTPRVGCERPRPAGYRRELDVRLTGAEATQASRSPQTHAVPNRPSQAPPQWTPPGQAASTLLQPPRAPQLLLTEVRHVLPALMKNAHILIQVQPGHEPSRPSRFLATTSAQRQRRRKTWEQRQQWNALPDDAVVHTHITAPPPIAHILKRPSNTSEWARSSP